MINTILELYSEDTFLKADGLGGAIIGVCENLNAPPRLVYSVKKSIEILMKDIEVVESELEEWENVESKKYELASEYFYYNVFGSYFGDKSPLWCRDDFVY